MMRWGTGVPTVVMGAVVVVLGTVLVGASATSGAVTDGVVTDGNEAPLADAGLDRNVSVNTTVYLDATGSRDPDGSVDGYRWRIERPDGHFTTPSCERCERTTFVPRATGTYNATVTITDEDGAVSTDTLRVHVEPSNGPTVTLSGPDSVVEGGVAEFTASVSAGANDLAGVVWRVDGRRLNRTALSGASGTVDRVHAFRRDGTITVAVTAVDRLGRQRTASKNVTVPAPASPDAGGGHGTVGASDGGAASSDDDSGDGTGTDDGTGCSRYGRDDDRYCDNDRMTIDSNGVVISDADNDGSTAWAGMELDEEFAQTHEGVSYDSTDGVATFNSQEAYREALGVDSVNVDPEAEVNSREHLAGINDPLESGSSLDTTSTNNTGSTGQDSPFVETNEDDQSNANDNGTVDEDDRIPERVLETIQKKKNGGS